MPAILEVYKMALNPCSNSNRISSRSSVLFIEKATGRRIAGIKEPAATVRTTRCVLRGSVRRLQSQTKPSPVQSSDSSPDGWTGRCTRSFCLRECSVLMDPPNLRRFSCKQGVSRGWLVAARARLLDS